MPMCFSYLTISIFNKMSEYVLQFDQLTLNDISCVGGKNASLGEMISQLTSVGVKVPKGFAVTADAYRKFLLHNALDEKINQHLEKLDIENTPLLQETGHVIRQMILLMHRYQSLS